MIIEVKVNKQDRSAVVFMKGLRGEIKMRSEVYHRRGNAMLLAKKIASVKEFKIQETTV